MNAFIDIDESPALLAWLGFPLNECPALPAWLDFPLIKPSKLNLEHLLWGKNRFIAKEGMDSYNIDTS